MRFPLELMPACAGLHVKRVVPGRLWNFVLKKASEELMARRIAASAGLPRHQLEERHVRNLRVVPNRLALLDRLPKHAIVAEVGVDQGQFTEQILVRTQPARLHLIDKWNTKQYHDGLREIVADKFAAQIEAGTVKINRGLSTEVLPTFADSYFDWVYIDTDHSYRTTSAELAIAARKVKQDGYICGHDYVIGNWKKGRRYGVIEAVHELCVKDEWELAYMTAEWHLVLSFALRRIDAGRL